MADPLSLIGLIVAIPGVIDLCIKYYDLLSDKYQGFSNNSAIKSHMRSLKDHLITIKYEIQILANIRESKGDRLILQLFEETLPELDSRVEAVRGFLEKFELWKDSRQGRLVYSLRGKTHAESLVDELLKTHAYFTYKLVLIDHGSRLTHSMGDLAESAATRSDALRLQEIISTSKARRQVADLKSKKLLLSPDQFQDRERIEDSEAWIQSIPQSSNNEKPKPFYIIDPVEKPPFTSGDDVSYALRTRELANTFYADEADRDFMTCTGIAQCQGFIWNAQEKQFELVLATPPTAFRPYSLRNLLSRPGGARHSISARIDLAKQLALSLYFVHAYDYVHKHIRPENILILPESAESASPEHIGKPLLIHFGQVRKFTQISQRIGDHVFLREIYRHPSRQGSDVQATHNFRHDIYSFGVVLLEIALWTNFADSGTRVSRALFSSRSMADGTDELPPTPEEIQRNFVSCARRQVARTMGNVYAGVVLTCLRCVEDGLGEVICIEDDDGIEISVKFIENVLQSLEKINV